ncbi:c-type cytochrome [Sulfuricurvum sp. RIFCSPLOWO2_12_FULL_43_24]|uniref:c-type cytochrome n=1 Tax=Sulfuricurvum sp. RIFCSPLOWO2_12_FULL_43_24 TaxID=1802247 RepID=UPI000A631603|nr:c-type cytochrome [Sulfuricurvum sp. RIFCSPLOWO2_12_FULL_43_24]
MKSLLSVVCALFILGCSNDSAPTEASTSAPEVITTPTSTETSVENNAPVEKTASTPAPTVIPIPEPTATKAPITASVDATALFGQKCASCHGAKAEKAALNKSQIIAQFSEAQIKEALKGYQAGTYGKDMKALMQGQTKALNDAQIDALAKYISNL